MNNDEHQQDYKTAAEAVIGAHRMQIGLACIPDKVRGDMLEVERLRDIIRRLSSPEAFGPPRAIDRERDEELLLRMEFAEAALKPHST